MEYRKCTSCSEEKELTDENFHERGFGFQKICKICRSIKNKERYATSGRNRTTTQSITNKDNLPTLAQIIQTIETTLRKKAHAFAGDNLEADDIYSAMVESILSKSQPTDPIAYFYQRANWAATDFVFQKQIYIKYVEPVKDGDEEAFNNVSSVEDEIVKQEVSAELKDAISQLLPQYQEIVEMLSIGYNQKQIAEKFQISENMVSKKMKRLRNQLTKLGIQPI